MSWFQSRIRRLPQFINCHVGRFDRQLTAVGHGVSGVDNEIHDDLLELCLIDPDLCVPGLGCDGQNQVLAD